MLVCFLLAVILGILSGRHRTLSYLGVAAIILIPFILDVRYFLSYSHQIDVLGPLTALLSIPIMIGRLGIALLLFSAGARLGRATFSVSLIAMIFAIMLLFAGYLLGKSYQAGYFAKWKNIGHPAEVQSISHLGDTDLEVITTDGRVFEADFLYSCGAQIGNEPARRICWYPAGRTPRVFEPVQSSSCWMEFFEPRIPQNATLVQHTITCYSDDQVAISTWAIVLDSDIWVWWVNRDKDISQLVTLTWVVLGAALGLQIGSAFVYKKIRAPV